MSRRKPVSAKQKKAELQLARAIKRGDEPAPPRLKPGQKRAPAARRNGPSQTTSSAGPKHLESAFLKPSAEFLAQSRLRASQTALARPIPTSMTVVPPEILGEGQALTCPKRPKWHYEDTKAMVEKNEEGQFLKWMAETDQSLHQWLQESDSDNTSGWGPSYFERNIEVWRQFWRVTELSDILIVLLDSRLPVLHYPPSLQAYLARLKPARKVILVLTKADITGPTVCASWKNWLKKQHPDVQIVAVESYRVKPSTQHAARPRLEPHIPPPSLQQLVDALKEVHKELLEPPAAVRADPEKLATWKPRVKEDVDWNIVLQPVEQRLSHVATTPPETVKENEKRYLTIGLIGQPNVGKSSLLNALFGEHKVKASRTPGKTKHYQTLFWTSDIVLCDCPGLVMPNYTHLELQVLCGVLPISRIPSLPSCVHYAADRLPLESVLKLVHPISTTSAEEDKRTWRPDQRARILAQNASKQTWTAMDIMSAFAEKNGWKTAKMGRNDVMRAGNALMRSLAEGRIKWAFWPPDSDTANTHGISLAGDPVVVSDEWHGDDSNDEESDDLSRADSESEGSETEEVVSRSELSTFGIGRFGALEEDAVVEDIDSERE